MQFFSADATIFSKKKSKFFAHNKFKNSTSKVAQINLNPLFFLTALTTEEFMFQNLAYRPIVYKTRHVVHNINFVAVCKIKYTGLNK